MSLEELFEKEYQELKAKVCELEKSNKLLKIDNEKYQAILTIIAKFIKKKIKPEFTKENGLLLNEVYLYDADEVADVLKILSQLGIKEIEKAIGEQQA